MHTLQAILPLLAAAETAARATLTPALLQEYDLLSSHNAYPWRVLEKKYAKHHALAVLAFAAETRAQIIVLTKYRKEDVA